ncbi:calcium-activated potassium channel subunit beta-3 [Oryzias melastigma]|uniref:calcium-activated potassium channel subunit beta-3 n=1 Tax=Oryzias melastigma TaxID=30732 RepID=UPI00168D814A|nr:calcium-activated potassium channel subunit beta-3 [Oryzias melastigma]
MQEQDHRGEGGQGQGARTQKQASSVGEDRAILLGFTMMAFSVLMFFVVGMTTVKPYINSRWEENSSCVLQQTAILERWVDCRGVSSMPCLTVTVYLNGSADGVFLHLDEESVFLSSVVSISSQPVFHCSSVSGNCQLSHEELHDEVKNVENNLTGRQGSTFPCFSSRKPYLSHAVLRRKYTLSRTLFGLLWPCLMLVGGAALVGLVKLTQWLGRLSSRAGGEAARCRSLTDTEGALYRLLQGSSAQSPS